MEANHLALEIQAYQALLEGHRLDPDNEDLYLDMLKAKAAMEVAWLAHRHALVAPTGHRYHRPPPSRGT